ncbi:MAG TPA: HlyD family secretion protein [Myxococcota bacterium]|nr:HlyD family secretion protein [Myxococcota bacterium]
MAEAVMETPARGLRINLRVIGGIVAAAVAIGVFAYWFLEIRGRETTDDAFIEGHLVFLSPRVAGQVQEVLVEENQHVKAGQVLVRLDPADFEARVAHAKADLEAAKNRMAQSSAAAEGASAQARGAAVHLRHAEQDLERTKGLFERKVSSQMQLDAAVAERDAAAAELRAAEQREHAERAMIANEAPVLQAQAALLEAELALEHATITAPYDGVIGRKSVELGANVSPGQPLVALAQSSQNWISANFKETQVGRMKPGDAVEIRVDAYPDKVWRGHVESISPATGAKYALLPPDNATGNFTKVVQRIPVRIALDAPSSDDVAAGPNDPLSVGLSVNVSVRVR